MPEIWFYHLERQRLEDTLPTLLERALERGWNAVVQTTSDGRLAALDDWLWAYAPDSFIPHGTAAEGDAEAQPVYLTTGLENPNEATVRFMVDGAEILPALQPQLDAYERVVLIFDGTDEAQLAAARAQWKAVTAAGLEGQYWKQDDEGKWKRAR